MPTRSHCSKSSTVGSVRDATIYSPCQRKSDRLSDRKCLCSFLGTGRARFSVTPSDRCPVGGVFFTRRAWGLSHRCVLAVGINAPHGDER